METITLQIELAITILIALGGGVIGFTAWLWKLYAKVDGLGKQIEALEKKVDANAQSAKERIDKMESDIDEDMKEIETKVNGHSELLGRGEERMNQMKEDIGHIRNGMDTLLSRFPAAQ